MMFVIKNTILNLVILLWRVFRMVFVFVLIFIIEITCLRMARGYIVSEYFAKELVEIVSCEGKPCKNSYRYEMTIHNSGSAGIEYVEMDLRGSNAHDIYQLEYLSKNGKEIGLDPSSNIVIPPGETVTFYLKVDEYDYENYKKSADKEEDVVLRFSYNIIYEENIPVNLE